MGILSPLKGLFFPVEPGGMNTGEGIPAPLTGEGEPSTLDTAVDDDAFDEVDENEFVELPDVERSVFTILGMDFADAVTKGDPPEEEDHEESPDWVRLPEKDESENEYVEEPYRDIRRRDVFPGINDLGRRMGVAGAVANGVVGVG